MYLTYKLINHMVYYRDSQTAMTDPLSETFGALADPTRRAILARLVSGEASVSELAAPFQISMPAISKHLKVLERAGLIARGREAQWRPCRLQAAPLKARLIAARAPGEAAMTNDVRLDLALSGRVVVSCWQNSYLVRTGRLRLRDVGHGEAIDWIAVGRKMDRSHLTLSYRGDWAPLFNRSR